MPEALDRIPLPVEKFHCVPEVKNIDSERKTVRHLITTNSIDRAGDIVEPKGADLENYSKNPVVMADHGYSIRDIIGTATDIKVSNHNIESTTAFGSAGLGPEAFALVEAKMARAFSIGFRSKDHHSVREGAKAGCKLCKKRFKDAQDQAEVQQGLDGDYVYVRGLHFLEWEMLEYSLVAIPMNQDIVANAIKRGLSPEHVSKFFRPEDHWVEDNIRRAFFPIEERRPKNLELTFVDDSDTSDAGITPDSEEEPVEAKSAVDRVSLYDSILGWRDELKTQTNAEAIRAVSRKEFK